MSGFANTSIRIFRVTYLLRQVPNHLMGRINSVFTLTNTSVRTLFSQAYFTTYPHITVPFLIIGVCVTASAMVIMLATGRLSTVRGEQLATGNAAYSLLPVAGCSLPMAYCVRVNLFGHRETYVWARGIAR